MGSLWDHWVVYHTCWTLLGETQIKIDPDFPCFGANWSNVPLGTCFFRNTRNMGFYFFSFEDAHECYVRARANTYTYTHTQINHPSPLWTDVLHHIAKNTAMKARISLHFTGPSQAAVIFSFHVFLLEIMSTKTEAVVGNRFRGKETKDTAKAPNTMSPQTQETLQWSPYAWHPFLRAPY